MKLDELAEELYSLIVIRGRWKGNPPNAIISGEYQKLPDWMKELWELKAMEFSEQNNFRIES